jgi:hypothetical protein
MWAQGGARGSLLLGLFRDGNLAETDSKNEDAGHVETAFVAEKEQGVWAMVACEQCAARFAASKEIEREWMQKHVERAHGEQRISRLARRDQLAAARRAVRV